MQLSDFNSYFEILVGINLGFAAVKYFRRIIRVSLFKKNHSTNKLDDLLHRLRVQLTESEDNPEFHKQLTRMQKKVQVATDTLDEKENNYQCFFELLRPISFMLSLLCVAYLLLAGFQISSDKPDLYCSFFFRLSCLVASYSFIIFYCTLSDRILINKLDVKLFEILIVFSVFSILSCDSVFLYLFANDILKIIGIALTPALLYVLIIAYRVLKLAKYRSKTFRDLLKDFWSLTKQNFLAGLIYVGVLLISIIPVIVYQLYNYISIYYLIVLTTPLLLYAFMFMRVWYHKHSFGKKYLLLSIEYSNNLDFALVDEKEKSQE
ncbi:hypothetical protein N1F78_11640 [Seonamhaeicola sp. MEBiC1930]|uniref:hypothetical protein n=1 Tax=Seonamhaeicola sp. MEBiC01930 TaxID=2976768 RepID=UPI003249FA1D